MEKTFYHTYDEKSGLVQIYRISTNALLYEDYVSEPAMVEDLLCELMEQGLLPLF